MKPLKTLEEVYKYLLYTADALFVVSGARSLDKEDRIILEKYAEDLLQYSRALDKLKHHIATKEQMKQKESEENQEN